MPFRESFAEEDADRKQNTGEEDGSDDGVEGDENRARAIATTTTNDHDLYRADERKQDGGNGGGKDAVPYGMHGGFPLKDPAEDEGE